jgi:hypothetical protein
MNEAFFNGTYTVEVVNSVLDSSIPAIPKLRLKLRVLEADDASMKGQILTALIDIRSVNLEESFQSQIQGKPDTFSKNKPENNRSWKSKAEQVNKAQTDKKLKEE